MTQLKSAWHRIRFIREPITINGTRIKRILRNADLIILFFLLFALFANSCKKPNFDDDVILKFSKTTVTFDTVFTSVGSITRSFTVHNPSNNDISTSINLAGAPRSYYSINVDGEAGTYFKNVVIPKKDSIFVFVKVNINPGSQNLPFLVTDSIVFQTGNNKQDVKLLAFGQDAKYIVADQGSPTFRYKIVAAEHQTVRWTNEKPYVVYGWAAIDSLGTLIIEPGTKIYFHNNSGLWAYRYSNLEVNGTLEEPVLFRGDRLESWYNEDYSQWNRIWVNEGANVKIDYAVITNAFIGIQVEPLPTNDNRIIIEPNVTQIHNTIIKNTKNSGILSRFLNLNLSNCVITNNGSCGLQVEGGNVTTKHLTIANYFIQAERKNPALYATNRVEIYDTEYPVNFECYNSIITGRNEDEVITYIKTKENSKVTFENCLVKAKAESTSFINCLRNDDPQFVDKNKLDFQLKENSPARGKGKVGVGVPFDILGAPRPEVPDLGAYQY